MLTKAASNKDRVKPEEVAATLVPIQREVLDDFTWGRKFGKVAKEGMVWKYGNPWRYPAHELAQLKSIIIGYELAEEKLITISRTTMPDVTGALGISEDQKTSNKKMAGSMAAFFKGLPDETRN